MTTEQVNADVESSRLRTQPRERPPRSTLSRHRKRDRSQARPPLRTVENPLARGLGWFGIGLGLIEVMAPRGLARAIGIYNHRALLRVFGLREIASGLGILSQPRPVGWMWGRVGGDAMDLAVLALALASSRSRRGRVAAATAAVAGVAVLDVLCSRQLSEQTGMIDESRAIRTHKSMTISRSPEELYRAWRDFDNLPRWMSHLESVRMIGENRSHWIAKGPAGAPVEWDAELTEDRPNEYIAWRSIGGSDVDHAGSVRFERAPAGRGTEVHVDLAYRPAGGMTGAAVAKLFGRAPDQQIQEDLRRFKQTMEAGEAPTTRGQPRGA
ncbi:MAG TPA: SRPBCC family protein [Nitrospiraceae bacterium]|nr:SRPBCC family protein [Nitrospiraceae bacterium]